MSDPRTLTAVHTAAREGVNVRRVTLPDGTTIDAGTVREAAELCGVTEATYRTYELESRTPLAGRPAPGPFRVRDEQTGEEFVARDPATGATLRNLDAVREWMTARTGKPVRTPDALRPTAWRRALLEHAEAGRLGEDLAAVELPGARSATAPERRNRRVAQAVRELSDLALIERDGPDRPYRITKTGTAVLNRFRKTDARSGAR